ncbi:hypothetical protein [Frankia tisae]|uniref:hypothetical protein n=1 Tax=Frankia tisae TaxID=2950104 RepID=UPI0021C1E7FB|nr:hypothetical protein [Frankia tisae]
MSATEIDPYRRWRRSLFWISVPLAALAILLVAGVIALVVVANRSGPDRHPAAFSAPAATNMIDRLLSTVWRAAGDDSAERG